MLASLKTLLHVKSSVTNYDFGEAVETQNISLQLSFNLGILPISNKVSHSV